MRLWKRLGQHRLFVRLMVPYFIIMFIALVLGGLFYNQTYRLIKEQTTHNNMQLLHQVKDTMDGRFYEMNRIAEQLLNDPAIMNFQRVRDPFTATTTYKVLETQKNLYSYDASNQFVLDYYLLFKNSELALSTDSIYELPSFYKHVLSYDGVDYDAWKTDLFTTYRNREVTAAGWTNYLEKPRRMLTYVHSFGYPNQVQGALVILVDDRNVQTLLSGIDVSDGGSVSIVDDKGRVISSYAEPGDEPAPDIELAALANADEGIVEASEASRNMMITYTTSPDNGWSYIVAQPPHVVLKKVITIRRMTLAIMLSFLAIGLILAYLFATRSGRPLVNLVSTLTERHHAGVPRRPKEMYGFIQQSLSHLIDNNAELQKEIDRQAPFLWESFLGRLLKGEFLKANEIQSLLRHRHVEIDGAAYAVGILHFHNGGFGLTAEALERLDIERVIVTESLRQATKDGKFAYILSEDKIALLFVDEDGDEAAFRQAIERDVERMIADILSRLPLRLRFAVGGFHDSLPDVAVSFEEARQALSAGDREDERQVVWYADLPKEQNGYYFPGETENRLINNTKAGETAEVEQLLQSLYRENFTVRNLPLAMQQLFLFEIVGCLVKVQDQLMLPDRFDVKPLLQTGATGEPKEAFRQVMQGFLSICGEIDQRKKSRNVRLLDDVLAFVGERYGDADVSLELVADRMNISGGYLSQFFKEQTGATFSEYLERLRMDRAKMLLAETDMRIGDIAEQAGYYSSSTFCRAFKRSSGISASSFRELARKDIAQGGRQTSH